MENNGKYWDNGRELPRPGSSMEPAMINFLEQYRRLLLGLKQKQYLNPSAGLGVSKMFFTLAAIQNIQLQKMKLFVSLHPNGSHPRQNNRFRESETNNELRLHRILQPYKKLTADLDPRMLPFTLHYLNELSRYYIKKRKLFSRSNGRPSPPWINPSVKPHCIKLH